MAFIDIKLSRSLSKALHIRGNASPKRQQMKVLQKLLKKARFTEFGQKYMFDLVNTLREVTLTRIDDDGSVRAEFVSEFATTVF